jgi:hypothetical protein
VLKSIFKVVELVLVHRNLEKIEAILKERHLRLEEAEKSYVERSKILISAKESLDKTQKTLKESHELLKQKAGWVKSMIEPSKN